MRIAKAVRAVAKYIGCLCIMFGVMIAAIAGGVESMETIKSILLCGAVVAGCSLPFFTVALIIEAVIKD